MAESTPPSNDTGMPAVDPMGNPLGSGAQAAQEPSFDGNKVIGRLKTAGEPDHEPPAEEQGGLRRWWENTKHEVGEALEHPVEGLKGAVKGTLNLVPQTAELVSKGAMHIVADDAQAVASALKWAGKEDWANATADFAKGTKTSAQNLDLPKFQMSNDAQRGGDTIATALSLATGVGGLVKSGAKAAAKGAARLEGAAAREAGGVERAIGQAEAASAHEAASTEKALVQAEKPVEVPPGNGTTVTRKSLREQYLGRTPSKKSRTGQEVQDRMRKEGSLRGEGDSIEFKSAHDGEWYPLNKADMAHKTDAVTWWNESGRQYGANSAEVRNWMLDSKNYYLEHYSFNRSAGAQLKQTYLPPISP